MTEVYHILPEVTTGKMRMQSKSQQFPAKFCAPIQNVKISPETVAQGAEECYILTVNRIRVAPMGAGFFSHLFRKRITGRLRNKF